MAPNLFGSSAALYLEAAQQEVHQDKSASEKASVQKVHVQKAENQRLQYIRKIVWRNVVAFTYLHIGSVYGMYLFFTAAKLYTLLWVFLVSSYAAFGITAGAHRLWSHRAYKAKWPLRLILMLGQTIAFQNHIFEWVRDHRVHHKFTDTDADPHNSQRGFFFSHMGWLLVRKHPDVMRKGRTIDMSDLEKDPIIVWQRRLYLLLMPVFCFLIPTWVPCRYWGESLSTSWYITLFRYTLTLHFTWLVNSAAHIWGVKPYDSRISSTENVTVAALAYGEGWHNYHHIFPWDYKAAELGNYKHNWSTAVIDTFAKIGWAYDLKTVSKDTIIKRMKKTGDGSTNPTNHSHDDAKWGWGDTDMKPEEISQVEIINKGD